MISHFTLLSMILKWKDLDIATATFCQFNIYQYITCAYPKLYTYINRNPLFPDGGTVTYPCAVIPYHAQMNHKHDVCISLNEFLNS